MVDVTRPKMHIWGENRVQKVIFTDEAPAYFAKGWRDHPSKVGKPLEVEVLPAVEAGNPGEGLSHESAPPPHTHTESRAKRAYNKRG